MAVRPRYFWIGIVLALSIAAACTIAAVSSANGRTTGREPLVSLEPSQPPGKGIGLDYGNTLFGASSAEIGRRLDDAVTLGADWIRVDLPWDGIQTTASTSSYDWSRFDTLVSAANARKLEMLITVVDPPSWARLPACAAEETCEPENPQSYAAFAGLAARRYAPLGVHDWEIWNEENLGGFSTAADPESAYAAVLIDAYGAIHAADKQATVMIGGLGMVQNEPSKGWIGAEQFLSGIAAAGGLDSADAVAVHPYDWNNPPAQSSVFKMIDDSGDSLESVLAKYGHPNTPFWITETGAPTEGTGAAASAADTSASHVTAARQAQLATAIIGTETGDPRIAALFWYSDVDVPGSDLYYGLRDADGAAKPAFSALRSAIAKYRASLN